ncbi:hypothetical protein N1851_008263 [Merluccius polli]|uniref:Uncharacterized protein n=1 Tax=Merluccius polli TaxID=89951 RepID=A0AA47N2V1_MERPO|nr:hypothetical protein N1851_008263 [Merluccius polli]
MFQQALIKGLKPAVQKTLKMVASLDYMSWEQWVEQLVHHYHLDQEKQEEKSSEYEDLKLQLLKMKIKEQADLNKKAKNTQEPSTMMPLATTPPTPQASAPTKSNTTSGVPGLGAGDACPQRYPNRGEPSIGASGDLTTRRPSIQLSWLDIPPAPTAISATTISESRI